MTESPKFWRNACWGLLATAFVAIAVTGLLDSEPMIGDEVTHYYMTVTQATALPGPNIHARIVMGNGTEEMRRYPQVFLWHYVGAIAWKYLGASFRVVECYQLLYVLQLMVALWLLVRQEERGDTKAGFLYLLSIVTLPLTLLFSVALYLDIPVLAQLVTALCLLRRGRPLASAIFMGIGLSIKITLIPVLPAYFALMAVQCCRAHGLRRAMVSVMAAIAIVVVSCVPMAIALKYKGAPYYPLDMSQQYLHTIRHMFDKREPGTASVAPHVLGTVTDPDIEREVISVEPGDVRRPQNLLLFGGGLVWLILAAAGMTMVVSRPQTEPAQPVSLWALWLGLFHIAITGLHLHEAPDIRFFLPGVVLVLLPVAQTLARLKWSKVWLPTLLTAGVLQSGVVLHKAHMLRMIRPGVKDAITYLKANPPGHGELFMYPEGNYRLFPIGHDWYLGYALKDFWKADNDTRIRMLDQRDLSAIVIKKYLVGKMDPEMTNLGIYPDYFVKQIADDPRFKKLYENDDVVIYLVPGALEKNRKSKDRKAKKNKGTVVVPHDATPATNAVPAP